MSSDPRLREQPKDPKPSELLEDIRKHVEANWRHVEEDVIRENVVINTNISFSKPAQNNQRRDGEGNGDVDREGERERLNVNFTCEFGEYVTNVRRRNVRQQNPPNSINVRKYVGAE